MYCQLLGILHKQYRCRCDVSVEVFVNHVSRGAVELIHETLFQYYANVYKLNRVLKDHKLFIIYMFWDLTTYYIHLVL